ncbi:MAG: glutamine amidotransferase [Planctomycetota bacterium]
MSNFPFLFGTSWPWWAIVLAGVGAGYFTWRGYRRRAAEVKPQRLRILKTLRLVGWGALFLCLLQPMRREYIAEKKASRLTVLVDDSESMSFADSRNGSSRLDIVKAALVGEHARAAISKPAAAIKVGNDSLLNVLARNFQVQLDAFGTTSHTVAQGSVGDLASGLIKELKALGESTDIAKALTETFARLKGPDANGLILISDGADTARGDLDRVCALYKRAGIPIYVLGVGETDLKDLAIAQIRCRRLVSKDTLARVDVDVRRSGFTQSDQETSQHLVYLKHNGQVVGAPVTLKMKNETDTATFEFLPNGQGFLEYEAVIEPFDGELVTANNSLSFGLVAYSRKLKALYMEGSMFTHSTYDSPNLSRTHPMQNWWEHQFLERALTEDLDVEVNFLAKDAYASPPGAPPLEVKTVKEGYPKTKKELYAYDVIICSDIPYHYFSDDQIQWTVDFVGKHGGGFVMVGGYTSFGEGRYAKTAVDRMLPVEMLPEDTHVDSAPDKPVNARWKLTDEAWSHPIMRLEKDDEKNRAAWAKMPAFHGFSRTKKEKGAATILAVVADEEYDTAYGSAPLVVVQPYGRGRSMAFASDTTGSWGTEWEDSWGPLGELDIMNRNLYYKTFWKNAVRWLAKYRLETPNQLAILETDRLIYSRGEAPEIRVKVMNEDCELTHDAQVIVNITAPDGQRQVVTVFPRYDEPGIYERKLELSAVGRYEIEAVATIKKDELGRDKALLQVRPASAELRQLSQNVELLKRLALETGGVYLSFAQAAELPGYLREATHVIEKHRDHDLWDRGWVFALIIGLLCSEWFLRKQNGLP